MKRFLRWFAGILLVLIILVVALILSFNSIARVLAEKKIRDETGMEAQIGKLDIGFRSPHVHLENFKLLNAPEFRGSDDNARVFVDLPELDVVLDADAFRSNKIHFKSIRLNLAEIHIVQTRDGKQNIDAFTKNPLIFGDQSTNAAATNKNPIHFDGIDMMELTLGRARFTSEKNPETSFDKNLGIQKRVYRDIRNEQDLESIQLLLALQSGMSIWLQQNK